MANESTYTGISAVINSVWETAFFTAREMNVVQPLVTVFADTNSSTPRKWTTYTGGTVQTITEATDMSAQTFTHAVAGTLTPVQYGAQYFLTDQRVNSDWASAARDAGTDLGQILAVKVDTDLVGNFAGYTGGTVGTAGGTITWANVMASMAILRANLAPAPYACVLRPEQWYYLTAIASNVPTLMQSQEWMNSFTRNYYVGSFGPVNFFIDANITAGTAAVAGMFSREAQAYDLRRALRIEDQRDASRGGGGYELNATMIYAEGVYRPTFGVQLIGTSTIA
jgi:hypothetical protein